MSNRRDRQIARMPLDERLISEVGTIASRPFVQAVEDHFAGYFNELGLTVVFAADAPDSDVITLQNDLLMHLNHFWETHKPDFTWMLMFRRGTEDMRTMFPGDKLRHSPEELHWRV